MIFEINSKFALLTFSLFIFLFQTTLQAEELLFRDSSGQLWQRTVLTEDRGASGTLVIVIEYPSTKSLVGSPQTKALQRVLFRKLIPHIHGFDLEKWTHAFLTRATPNHPELNSETNTHFHQPIWTASRQWTAQDEADYGNWVQTTVGLDYLDGSNVTVDCADLAITLRWIYAHDHGLPAANSLAASGALFGNWAGQAAWDKLPTNPIWKKDLRFKAALKYLLDNTYTHSIIADLYPVQISKDFVTPGSIDLVLYNPQTGHTQVVKQIGPDANNCGGEDCMTAIWGNEPQSSQIFTRVAWIVNGGIKKGGFLRWRWPVQSPSGAWTLTAPSQMPGYSLEQYSYPNLADTNFRDYIYDSVGIPGTALSKLKETAYNLISILGNRRDIVERGFVNCGIQLCDPSDKLYEGYSTPNLDRSYKAQAADFVSLYNSLPAGDVASVKSYLESVTLGKRYRPAVFNYIFNVDGIADKMSADPRESIANRWAYDPTDLDTDFSALVGAWFTNWWDRTSLVGAAQRLCYPNSQTTLECDVNSPEIQALNTARIDQNLKSLRTEIKKRSTQVSQGVLDDWKYDLTYLATAVDGRTISGCSKVADSYCSGYDFLLSPGDWIDNMSSDPTAPLLVRFGVH